MCPSFGKQVWGAICAVHFVLDRVFFCFFSLSFCSFSSPSSQSILLHCLVNGHSFLGHFDVFECFFCGCHRFLGFSTFFFSQFFLKQLCASSFCELVFISSRSVLCFLKNFLPVLFSNQTCNLNQDFWSTLWSHFVYLSSPCLDAKSLDGIVKASA